MESFKISPIIVWLVMAGSILLFAVCMYTYIFNTQSVVVFCNVGQGDAAYLRINNKVDVLIDSGPDSRVLDCLGKYMPFYDKTIELAFLSHPHFDHYGGFLSLAGRYHILKLFKANHN